MNDKNRSMRALLNHIGDPKPLPALERKVEAKLEVGVYSAERQHAKLLEARRAALKAVEAAQMATFMARTAFLAIEQALGEHEWFLEQHWKATKQTEKYKTLVMWGDEGIEGDDTAIDAAEYRLDDR